MTTFIFGEAMLEFHSEGTSGFRFGGDTLNTAIHLARAGHKVAYVTALGSDPVSDRLIDAWDALGIDTRFVMRHPTRQPGIYAITLDPRGERSFLYWRDQSAARAMFDLPGIDAALDAARSARLLYFSLISLAIIGPAGRDRLLDLARMRKSDGLAVAYDSNFRRQLWPEPGDAREVSARAMQSATIGLPTNTDEAGIWDAGADPAAILDRWRKARPCTTVLKAGDEGCYVASDAQPGIEHHPARPVNVVDTSGAGDAFNGGFLGAWLEDRTLPACINAGQDLASRTLLHKGAMIL